MGETRFARDAGQPIAQFEADEDYELLPLNSADAQAQEAMALTKLRNRQEQESESIIPVIEKMDSMNVAQAIDYLDAMSQHERERHLRAEQISKNRKGILAAYGWE